MYPDKAREIENNKNSINCKNENAGLLAKETTLYSKYKLEIRNSNKYNNLHN